MGTFFPFFRGPTFSFNQIWPGLKMRHCLRLFSNNVARRICLFKALERMGSVVSNGICHIIYNNVFDLLALNRNGVNFMPICPHLLLRGKLTISDNPTFCYEQNQQMAILAALHTTFYALHIQNIWPTATEIHPKIV